MSCVVGRIFNALYNGGAFTPEQLARFGQQAENRHFGKPSGLMDQMACARSGAVYLDLAAGEILPVAAPFAAMGLTLCLTDTGGSHAGLTAAYAALPADMTQAVKGKPFAELFQDFFTKMNGRALTTEEVLAVKKLREEASKSE